ncbi:MAG: hypothetical protein K6C06_04300 [Lachnospiraceae bacterium]|nr:hypothetical protein [Lachnospiraceae bacterium]
MSDILTLIKSLDSICDSIDRTPAGLAQSTNLTLKEALRADLAAFAMYISASDGKVTSMEANFVSYLLGTRFTTADLANIIQKAHIYSTSFEQTVPPSLKSFVIVDAAMIRAGKRPQTLGSEILLKLFGLVGAECAKVDNGVADQEQKDFSIYMNMLQNFIRSNL